MRFPVSFFLLALPCLAKSVVVREDPTSDIPCTEMWKRWPESVDMVRPYERRWRTWVQGPNYVFNKTFHPPHLGNGTQHLPIVKAAEAFVSEYGPPSFRFSKRHSSIHKDGISYLHFLTQVGGRDVPERWFIVQMASNRSIISYEKRMDLQPRMPHLLPDEIVGPVDALRIVVETLYLEKSIKRNPRVRPDRDSRGAKVIQIRGHNIANRYIIGEDDDNFSLDAIVELEPGIDRNNQSQWYWSVSPRDQEISSTAIVDVTTGEIVDVSVVMPIFEVWGEYW